MRGRMAASPLDTRSSQKGSRVPGALMQGKGSLRLRLIGREKRGKLKTQQQENWFHTGTADPAYTPQAPRRRVQALGLQAGGPSGQSISVSSELLFCVVGISASASLLGRVGFFWSRGEASGLLKVFC